jgi:hypothetical protein
MRLLLDAKENIIISIYDFKHKCETFGQNGTICAGISEALKETLSNEQITILIEQLKK